MAKPEWGKKRMCRSCGAVFYDLRRKTISCPKCGTAYDPEPPVKGKRAVAAAAASIAAAAPKPKPASAMAAEKVPPGDALEILAGDGEIDADDPEPPAALAGKAKSDGKGDDKEEALIEDASDLGEDEDDIGEVKEHIDDGVGDKA